MTLTVLSGQRVVAELSTTRPEAGRGVLTWNDKIQRRPAARGIYQLKVRAVSPAGASARDAAALRIADGSSTASPDGSSTASPDGSSTNSRKVVELSMQREQSGFSVADEFATRRGCSRSDR